MPGRGGMGPHDNPNLAFLHDILNNRTLLQEPVQTFLVQSIQGAYNMGIPNPGEYPLRATAELIPQFPGPVPQTIAEAENVLFNSFLPQALRYGQKLETTSVGLGDIISELYAPSDPKAKSFHEMVMGWNEKEGGVFQYMTNALKNAATSGKKSFSATGMHLDPKEFSNGLGGIVEGPDPDRQLANQDFLGAPAAYDPPDPLNWYEQLAENTAGKTVPTPFYAPAGQGMFVQDPNGRTVINPKLTRNPGFIGTNKDYLYNPKAGVPLHRYQQVSVTGEEIAAYAQTLDAYYRTEKDQRVIDFGTGPQVKGVNKFLRGLNNQMQGLETVSTDAQVIGSVAGADDAFLRVQHPETGFFDLTVEGRPSTAQAVNAMTLKQANALIARRTPMEGVPFVADPSKALPVYRELGVNEHDLPVTGESNKRILENELYLQKIRQGGLSRPAAIDPAPDAAVPLKTVNEALWDTLQSFSSPTEKLMLAAADEAMIMGRLLPNKVSRWKEYVTRNEDRLEKASSMYGFDYVRPNLAKAQTRTWAQAKTASEVQARSKEQLVTDIEQDPEIPAHLKEQAIENALSGRGFGQYGSQRAEAEMRLAKRLTEKEEAELAQLDENGMRIRRDQLDGTAQSWDDFVAQNSVAVERLAAHGLPFRPVSGGSGQQPPNNNRTTFGDPEEPNDQPNGTERTQNERLSGVGNARASNGAERLNDIELSPEDAALHVDARQTIQRLRRDFPEWTPGRGTSAWFRQFKADNPGFAEGHRRVMEDVRMSERTGVPSALEEAIEEINGRGPASNPQPAPASGTGRPSTNGSRGGSDGSTTSTPGIDPFENVGRREEASYEDEAWYNNGGFDESIANDQDISPEQWEDARRRAGQTAQRRVADRTPDAERFREDIDQEPLSTPGYVRPAPAPLTSDALRGRLMMGINTGLRSRLARSSEYQYYNQSRQKWETRNLPGGNTHEMYGGFVPEDADLFAIGQSNAGSFFNTDTGAQTLTSTQVARGASIVEQAVSGAVSAGGLEGLNNKELAATIYKRVAEGVATITRNLMKEAEQISDPAEAMRIKEDVRKSGSAAYDIMNRGVVDQIRNMTGVNAREVGNPAVPVSTPEQLNALASRPGMEALARRIQELGGAETLMTGEQRIIGAEGVDQTYEVGKVAASRGRGRWGGDFFQSIYGTDMGKIMMAQFMGQMAWQQTGGAVLDTAATWAGNQYGYLGLESYGAGDASGPAGFMARQEIAANRQGALAYEQYGFVRELGYAYSDPLLNRLGNDIKMGLGVGTIAGIGAYSAAGLGLFGAGVGGAAAAGFGATVGATVGAAVAIPAVIGSAYNVATDQDSYMGWSPKNMLSSLYAMPGPGDAMKMYDLGYEENEIGLAGAWLSFKGALGIGSAQEENIQRRYGMSAEQFAVLTGTDADKAKWLFASRDEKSQDFHRITRDIQESTLLKEDVVTGGLSAMQVAFGGLDTGQKELAAKFLFKQAADQGVTAESLLSGAGNIANMRGILEGTDEFMGLALNYANMSPVEQQKFAAQAGRDFQKYAQWTPYLQGGNAEAYGLFTQLGGTNAAQTQVIQSVLAQAQMSGASMTPEVVQNLAQTANGMAPWRAQDVAGMASQMYQVGTGSFSSNFTSLAEAANAGQFGFSLSDIGNLATGSISAGVGNQADTLNFLKGVTSGNAYALSDYGRMAGIGVLQSMDPNGLQTGLKDMSGLLSFARQNILGNDNLTGAQTLSGLGLTFSQTDQTVLLNGGIWGYQQSYVDQTNNLQMQGINQSYAQLASNRQFMYESWGLETRMNNLQWEQTLSGFGWQNTMLDTNNRFRLEDAALTRQQREASNENSRWNRDFDYQTNLMRRDWAREDYQYNTQMRQLSFGWQMEDMDEQIRRSSGYERAMLIRQRDRATLSENMQSGQAEKQFDRQEQLWAREDERYEKSLAFSEQMIQLDQERFELNQRQADEMYALQKTRLGEEMEMAGKQHDLRLEIEALQRERQEEQLRFQEQSLDLQKQQALLQNEYANNMTKISHTQTEMEAALRKITSYQPAFSRLLQEFLSFLEEASTLEPPSTGGITYR